MEQTQGFFSFIFESMGEALYSIIIWVVLAFFVTQIILFFYKEKILLAIKNNKKMEMFFASMLGLIPGCGGTIFLIPLYKEKVISFGALIAAFITTLGETTFIILFFNPMAFLIFLIISIIVSLITGYIINIFDFEQKLNLNLDNAHSDNHDKENINEKETVKINKNMIKIFEMFDKYILPIFLAFVVLILFPLTLITSFSPTSDYKSWVDTYIKIADYISLVLFILFIPFKIFRDSFEKKISKARDYDHYHTIHSNDEHGEVHKNKRENKREELFHELRHMFITILFIVFWIYISIIFLSTIVYIANISSVSGLNNISEFTVTQGDGYRFLILIFVLLVSLIPVCGPQIFVVTLFGQGYIAFSALSANSISQNGHAGLVMLSADKKSYFWIKTFILIPAFIVGFFFFIIEITTGFSNWMYGFNRSIV